MKPENEWIKITSVPKIVDEKLFAMVGEQLRSNFMLSQRNTKNEYLLAGMIWCSCGKRRAGEGPQQGKHLYYRCTDRIKNFPLPPSCVERGINARIVDKLVWQKISQLMSSPKLITKQAEIWSNNHKKGVVSSPTIDIQETEKEISKLKEEENRYNKAYGAGVISLDQLKEYTKTVKEKINLFENQINKAKSESLQTNETRLPDFTEIESFAQQSAEFIPNLNFESRKAIIRRIVDRVVGTKQELQVYGYLPINNINVLSSYRHGVNTTRHNNEDGPGEMKIPIRLTIKLPPPMRRGIDYGFMSSVKPR